MELDHLVHVNKSIGQTLCGQELSNLEIGLTKRNATESFASMQFWGRITGTKYDYNIAVGTIKTGDYPKRKYFFWYVDDHG